MGKIEEIIKLYVLKFNSENNLFLKLKFEKHSLKYHKC